MGKTYGRQEGDKTRKEIFGTNIIMYFEEI
jgi:hypothetical protein